MSDELNIVLYQSDVNFGNFEDNLKALKKISLSHFNGNTLILAPELFLTGYHKESIQNTAFSDSNPSALDLLLNYSEEHSIALYCSISEKFEDQYYNTAILLDGGRLIAKYRKSHLFGPLGEKEIFTSGKQVVTSNLYGWKVGLSICYDLRFPELYNAMSPVDAFLLVAEWPNKRINHWNTLISARSIEHQTFTLAVNRVGNDPFAVYGGNSQIIDPLGSDKVKLDESIDVKSVFISKNMIQEAKELFNINEDKWLNFQTREDNHTNQYSGL
jgi:omega-amidase